MADSNHLQAPDQVAGYKKVGLEPLGAGGMGVVWLYKEIGLPSRDVAIKFINAAKIEFNKPNLMREIQVLSALPPHQNVIAMHSVIEEPFALVMEYVPGNTSLRSIIKGHQGGLPVGLALQILKGILEGVAHAHAHKVFHRDVKPENILIRLADGQRPITHRCVKIVDFGVSKIYRKGSLAGAAPSEISIDGNKPLLTLLGAYTEAYAAPEQINGEATGAYTDIYQIGVILHEMLSGSRPFTGKTSEVIAGHCYRKPPAIERADLPGPLAAILATAMGKNPKDRYMDAEEMLCAIRGLGDVGDMGDAPETFIEGGAVADDSVTIRAGIKQKGRPGQEVFSGPGAHGAPEKGSQVAFGARASNGPDWQSRRPSAAPRAKKPRLKYALFAIAGIALLAAALPLSNSFFSSSKKGKPKSAAKPAAAPNSPSLGESANSQSSYTQSASSVPNTYSPFSPSSPSSYSGSSNSSTASAPAPSRAAQTPPSASEAQKPSPASKDASKESSTKTLGIGEAFGTIAGTAVREASQAKEKQDLGSLVDKGLGLLSGAIAAPKTKYVPPDPSWPAGAPAGAQQSVSVQVQIGANGVPTSAKVIGSPPDAFRAPAIDYAMRHQFYPREDSKPSSATIVAKFKPSGGSST